MALASGFQKGESLSPILFSGPWVKESCVPAPEGGDCLLLWVTLEEWRYYPHSHHYLP